jgi:hypothetical protein
MGYNNQNESAFKTIRELALIGETIKVNLVKISGKKFIDVRKYYIDRKTQELMPTRKGIVMSMEDWDLFCENIDEINYALDGGEDTEEDESVIDELPEEVAALTKDL